MEQKQKIAVILGTNASGKSAVGLELAREFGGEIISADSRQVYRGFDLCSGKVTAEERRLVPHHMLDIVDIGQQFSVADFQRRTYELIPEIASRGNLPFIVGGTGLYSDSVTQGYVLEATNVDYALRAELESKTLAELSEELDRLSIYCLRDNPSDSMNKRRIIRLIEKARNGESIEKRREPIFASLQLGVTWPKDILNKRILERLRQRIRAGMIDEVDTYLKDGGDSTPLVGLGLEYKHIFWYLSGKYASVDELIGGLFIAIRQFAKRQLTWFRRNKDIIWLDMQGDYLNQARELIRSEI